MSYNVNIDYILHSFNDLFEVLDFLKILKAEALISLNPMHLPAHLAGSIIGQDLKNADSLIAKPFTNLKITKEYLTTAHNRSHFYSRAREVGMDTLDVNAYSEWSVINNAGSGVFANLSRDRWYHIKITEDHKLIKLDWTDVNFWDSVFDSTASKEPTVEKDEKINGNLSLVSIL